ncbi:MAG: hypothetical protein NVSMB39_5190 [Candidatus Saccharimonadales bacterium]
MIKTSILRYAAIGLASVSMAGFAAASTVSFDTTGAESTQIVKLHNNHTVTTTNKNNVGVANVNWQQATSGRVNANENTSIEGSVGSGNAANHNSTSTDVTVSNAAACGCAGAGAGWTAPNDNVSMTLTGHDSLNKVTIDNSSKVTTKNTNNVNVVNLNAQSAKTGNVTANENTTIGGDVMSGDASNTSSTTTSVSVSN